MLIFCRNAVLVLTFSALILSFRPAWAEEPLYLQQLVTPSTVIVREGRTVPFAVHGFDQFNSLAELFPYIEGQTRRWENNPDFDEAARRNLSHDLLQQGIESRVVSMIDERPLETIITHTRKELEEALANVKEPTPAGYPEAFLGVQDKWKHALNCWSASPSIPGRVLSNWYPIAEGIPLYGAVYDSTEHFWQAVKYHPDVTVRELLELLGIVEKRNWTPWLRRLDDDPKDVSRERLCSRVSAPQSDTQQAAMVPR